MWKIGRKISGLGTRCCIRHHERFCSDNECCFYSWPYFGSLRCSGDVLKGGPARPKVAQSLSTGRIKPFLGTTWNLPSLPLPTLRSFAGACNASQYIRRPRNEPARGVVAGLGGAEHVNRNRTSVARVERTRLAATAVCRRRYLEFNVDFGITSDTSDQIRVFERACGRGSRGFRVLHKHGPPNTLDRARSPSWHGQVSKWGSNKSHSNIADRIYRIGWARRGRRRDKRDIGFRSDC